MFLEFSEFSVCFNLEMQKNLLMFLFGLVKMNLKALYYESEIFPFEIARGNDTKARTAVLVVKGKIFIR